MKQKTVIALCAVVICLGLASCGKRGDLLPPSAPEQPAEQS